MSSAQIVKAKSPLSAKVGRMPTFDPQALARAEAALNGLSSQFDDWMKIEAEKLAECRDTAKAEQWSDQALAVLFTRAHDIKGLGATYRYPITASLASSLCRLLEAPRENLDRMALAHLASAHVETIRAVVRDGVRDESHPVAAILLQELTTQVNDLLATEG
jgi:hypothetical protein